MGAPPKSEVTFPWRSSSLCDTYDKPTAINIPEIVTHTLTRQHRTRTQSHTHRTRVPEKKQREVRQAAPSSPAKQTK